MNSVNSFRSLLATCYYTFCTLGFRNKIGKNYNIAQLGSVVLFLDVLYSFMSGHIRVMVGKSGKSLLIGKDLPLS